MRYSVSTPMMPLQLFPFSRRIVITAGISIAALFLAVLFSYAMYARALSGVGSASVSSAVSSGTVYLSPSAQNSAPAAAATSPMLEMHIANDGLVLLRGARVLSVSGDTIMVEMAWGSSTFTWKVATNYNSEYFAPTGEKETLSDIQPGDTVTVTGMLAQSGTEPVINAQYVREE